MRREISLGVHGPVKARVIIHAVANCGLSLRTLHSGRLISRKIGLPHSILRSGSVQDVSYKGFTRVEFVELCVNAANEAIAESEKVTWPAVLGLYKFVVAC
jgi:hypothetical protein